MRRTFPRLRQPSGIAGYLRHRFLWETLARRGLPTIPGAFLCPSTPWGTPPQVWCGRCSLASWSTSPISNRSRSSTTLCACGCLFARQRQPLLSLSPSLRPSVPPSLRPSLPLRVCVCARARAVRFGRMQRDPHTRCGGCRAHTEIPIFAVTLYLGMIFYLPQHLGEAPGKGIVRKAWGIWNLLLSIFRRAARTLPLC
jgi:hypothetical protein